MHLTRIFKHFSDYLIQQHLIESRKIYENNKRKRLTAFSTASLMGVEIQNEFIYPFQCFFALYLSDYFDDSLFVFQGEHHPLSELHCSTNFHDCGNFETDFHNRGNRSSCCRIRSAMWYIYLNSDSNRSVIFTPNAIAIISS